MHVHDLHRFPLICWHGEILVSFQNMHFETCFQKLAFSGPKTTLLFKLTATWHTTFSVYSWKWCWNRGPCGFIKCKSVGISTWVSNKAYTGKTNESLWLLMIYRRLMQWNNWYVQETKHFFTALLPVIQILMQTVQGVVWFESETFFWTGYFT